MNFGLGRIATRPTPLTNATSEGQANKHNMLATLESKTKFGWLYLRYKHECWWYEFVIFAQRTCVIAASLFLSDETAQATIIGAALSIAVYMHLRYVPYYSRGSRHVHKNSGTLSIAERWRLQATGADRLMLLCLVCELSMSVIGVICIQCVYASLCQLSSDQARQI